MEVPRQFRERDFRFLIIKPRGKAPIEEWRKHENRLCFDDGRLLRHMEHGGNIGILGGYGNLVVVDCDKEELSNALRQNLPATLYEKSAKGEHYFYKCPGIDYFQSLDIREVNGNVTHFGEIRADKEHQTVIAPSMHETGVQYRIMNEDAEIAEISFDMIISAVTPFLNPQVNWNEEQRRVSEEKRVAYISLDKLLNFDNYKQIANGEFQGPHPTHGSTTGINFCFNIEKQLWHCFRHNCGGTGLHLLAMMEGRLQCGQMMDTLVFLDMVRVAKEKYNVNIIQPRGLFKPFEDYGIPEPVTWLWDRYIPSRGICVIAAYTGVGKSLISEEFISAICNNRQLFWNYDLHGDNRPVVLIDMENDHSTLYERLNMMGGIPNKKLYVFNFDESFDMEDAGCIQELTELIKEIDPCLVIMDTLRRTYSGDENDSKVINKVFRTALGPISKHRCVMVLAHYRKRSNNPKATDILADDLSNIRGTGDITGIASSVILLTKNYDNSISIRSDKVRCAPKPDELITVNVIADKEKKTLKVLYSGTSENVVPGQDNAPKKVMQVVVHNFGTEPFLRKNLAVLVEQQHICKTSRLSQILKELVKLQHLTMLNKGKYQVNNSQVNISDYIEAPDDDDD